MIDKTNKMIKRVAFFGDATLTEDSLEYQKALTTAALLSVNGYIIVNGGGSGIMAAATEGAKSVKGEVEIVIIDETKQPDNYEGIDKENFEYAQIKHVTDNYPARLSKLMEVADAYVVFKGGTGTLSEVGMVWEQGKFDYGNHEPVIFVGEEWREIVKLIETKMNYEEIEKKVVTVVNSPEEVLEMLRSMA